MIDASLIVSIVRRGWGSSVLEATVKAGARGGTVLFGRGAGINEQEKIFGMSIEPEKEIVLTVARAELIDRILEEIVRAAELNDTGRGIAFVVPVERMVGVAHFMKQSPRAPAKYSASNSRENCPASMKSPSKDTRSDRRSTKTYPRKPGRCGSST